MGKFLLECGMGVDLHGQNLTKASKKAVQHAISNSCMGGLADAQKNFGGKCKVLSNVTIGAPRPEEVDTEVVASALVKGMEAHVQVVKGGLTTSGVYWPAYGDKDDTVDICVAAVEVNVVADE